MAAHHEPQQPPVKILPAHCASLDAAITTSRSALVEDAPGHAAFQDRGGTDRHGRQTSYLSLPGPSAYSAAMTAEPVAPPGPTKTFGDHVDRRDAADFVGRARELALLDRVLDPTSDRSVVLIHGPGGIGKSAVLREVRRRARDRGYDVALVDGRVAGARVEEFDAAGARLASSTLPLLLVDTYERSAAIGPYLRTELLPRLPATTRLVVACRRPPEPAWFENGWESVAVDLPLGPLAPDDARKLLSVLGRHGPAVDGILRWAAGEPLALVVAATHGATAIESGAWTNDIRLADVLVERLVGQESSEAHRHVLDVASVAAAVDARLLADVLGLETGETAIAWLERLSFSEAVAGRVTLHDRVRQGWHSRLRNDHRSWERELRRRLADHLHERASEGDTRFLREMGALFEDPRARWAWAADGGGAYRADGVRPGDEAEAAAALEAGSTSWWAGVRRWFAFAPQCVTTVRDVNGQLAGFCILTTPHSAPEWAHEDPVMGPRLKHAGARFPSGNVVVWRDAFGFPPGMEDDPAIPLMTALQAGIVSSGRLDSLSTYGSVIVGDPVSTALANAYGATPVPDLTVVDGERVVEGRVLDHGFGGFIGAARARVYADLSLPLPAPTLASVREAVHAALRAYHDPVALAASPLAVGSSTADRAEAVRALLRDAMDRGFGERPDQQLIRKVVELGYFAPDCTHDNAARALHLGRSTYFRHLSQGVNRIAAFVDDVAGG
jgi:hypothetical protein